MNITLTHCRYAPKWESLETIIREATNEPKGVLIRINRKDGGVNYRAPGEYDLSFLLYNGCILPIDLSVKGY